MKLTNPQIQVVNHVGQIGSQSFPPSNGVATAHLAYKQGAENMAKMFRDALQSGNLKKVLDLAQATEQTSFYEY